MFGDNVVTRAVAQYEAKVETLTPDQIRRLEENSELDSAEWIALGDMASRAMISGHIDADTAQTLHAIHSDYRTTATLAQKMVFLQVASELLAKR